MAIPYRDPSPSPLTVRALGVLNRTVTLPAIARIERIDLPGRDLARLRAAVNPGTAAFLTPNHPEFMTDWMIDRELACRVSPSMASWATAEIVNASRLTQRFWLANGLIAAVPGGGGKAFSLAHARRGHGILLHPEGAVSWQAERVAPLRPGAVDMALQLAAQLDDARDPRPVLLVPIVWRVIFAVDAAPALIDEMQRIERACGLRQWPASDPGERLARMLSALLLSRAHRLGLTCPPIDAERDGREYFEAQAAVLDDLRRRLRASINAAPVDDSPFQWRRAAARHLRRSRGTAGAAASRIADWLQEYQRLMHLDPALYGSPTLSQEQIAEILKATRAAVMTTGWRQRLHNMLPRAVAPRVAHIRVAEPIDVRAARRYGAQSGALQQQLAGRLQRTLDQLGVDVERSVQRRRVLNPMVTTGEDDTAHAAWRGLGA